MSTATTSTTAWQWPPDFVECARRFKIEDCLDPLLNAVRELFPTARSLKPFKEDDPEIPDYPYLVFEVRVGKNDIPDFRSATKRWHEVRTQILPSQGHFPVRLTIIQEDS